MSLKTESEKNFLFQILDWNSRLEQADQPNLLWLDFRVSTVAFNQQFCAFDKLVENFGKRGISLTKIVTMQSKQTWIRFKKNDMTKSFKEH